MKRTKTIKMGERMELDKVVETTEAIQSKVQRTGCDEVVEQYIMRDNYTGAISDVWYWLTGRPTGCQIVLGLTNRPLR